MVSINIGDLNIDSPVGAGAVIDTYCKIIIYGVLFDFLRAAVVYDLTGGNGRNSSDPATQLILIQKVPAQIQPYSRCVSKLQVFPILTQCASTTCTGHGIH